MLGFVGGGAMLVSGLAVAGGDGFAGLSLPPEGIVGGGIGDGTGDLPLLLEENAVVDGVVGVSPLGAGVGKDVGINGLELGPGADGDGAICFFCIQSLLSQSTPYIRYLYSRGLEGQPIAVFRLQEHIHHPRLKCQLDPLQQGTCRLLNPYRRWCCAQAYVPVPINKPFNNVFSPLNCVVMVIFRVIVIRIYRNGIAVYSFKSIERVDQDLFRILINPLKINLVFNKRIVGLNDRNKRVGGWAAVVFLDRDNVRGLVKLCIGTGTSVGLPTRS